MNHTKNMEAWSLQRTYILDVARHVCLAGRRIDGSPDGECLLDEIRANAVLIERASWLHEILTNLAAAAAEVIDSISHDTTPGAAKLAAEIYRTKHVLSVLEERARGD